MTINFSTISKAVTTINNPASPLLTIIEEVPTDIGRSYEGYKRGGIIEGAEKMRKELLGAAIWIFGIGAFKKIGDKFCEAIKIPMNLDFSNNKEGNDAIGDSVRYLTGELKNPTKDVSELKKYGKKFVGENSEKLIKNIKAAKKITSISAVVLNCIAMGIILPKINQKLTADKLKKMNNETQDSNKKNNTKILTMDEFQNSTQKNKEINFKGKLDNLVYKIENDNKTKLIITDIPMILGRCLTSRNKYEALEYIVMDGASIYCYNYSANHIQKFLRKITNTTDINPKVAELIQNAEPETLKTAFESDLKKPDLNLKELFKNEKLANQIYDTATYGKYSKINRYVKNSDIKDIDNSVINFIDKIKSSANQNKPLYKDGKLNSDLIQSIVKKTNLKNAAFMAAGLGASILGLGVLIPRLTFWITKQLTGKNEFVGLADYSDENKNKA